MTSPGGLSAETAARAAELVALYPQPRSALIPVCHLAQAADGYLTNQAMVDIAELLGVSPAEVLGTASFYDMIHTEPVGRFLVGICTNVACLLSGGEELLGHAAERLGVRAGGTTTDGTFTLEELECVALCDRAPCATVNWRYFGPLTNEGFDTLMDDLAAGHLDEEVPPHGTLNRVRREGGLAVPREKVMAERGRQDRNRAARKSAADAVAAAKAELEKVHAAQATPGGSRAHPSQPAQPAAATPPAAAPPATATPPAAPAPPAAPTPPATTPPATTPPATTPPATTTPPAATPPAPPAAAPETKAPPEAPE